MLQAAQGPPRPRQPRRPASMLKDDPVLAWVTPRLRRGHALRPDRRPRTSFPSPLRRWRRQEFGCRGGRAGESASSRLVGAEVIADGLRGFGLKAPVVGRLGTGDARAGLLLGAAGGGPRPGRRRPALLGCACAVRLPADRRSLVRSRDGGLLALSGKKRLPGRPYAVGPAVRPDLGRLGDRPSRGPTRCWPR